MVATGWAFSRAKNWPPPRFWSRSGSASPGTGGFANASDRDLRSAPALNTPFAPAMTTEARPRAREASSARSISATISGESAFCRRGSSSVIVRRRPL
jgi:hypothetical protein